MPNHILNRLFVDGPADDVAHLMAAIQTTSTRDDGTQHTTRIDFNTIIPQPEGLDVAHGMGAWAAMKLCEEPGLHTDRLLTEADIKANSVSEEAIPEVLHHLRLYEEHGSVSWHHWSVTHWGTKWNAYESPNPRDTEDTIFFETAWSAPLPVLTELSHQCPTISLLLDYADEDIGHNCGSYRFEGGIAQRIDRLTYHTPEATKFAIVLWYGLLSDDELRDQHGLNSDYTDM